ncbi:uncharacterized protein LOC116205581 isoform X1 [Punica granatum]|uniref:Uncharacterized protein LOC116205581 isoform X1 n=1 Tax=Punica granatum TaxID=22663 RepID=A0A6P8DBU8_PUNGR|nr:uncharacterized protein LOC116205581 isoform X1 [Punica granatum]
MQRLTDVILFFQLTGMAVEDGNSVGSMSLALRSSSDTKQSGDVLSPEDIAWVDSCLTKDLEVHENGWDSLKQALLEALESSAVESGINQSDNYEVDMIMIPSAEESETAKFSERADDDDLVIPFLIDEARKESESSVLGESLEAQTSVGSPFLPNYKEFPDEEEGKERVNVSVSPGFKLEALENDPTGKDIFKVWELEIPEEEDDFAKELNKALAASEESSNQIPPSQPENYPGRWNDGGDGSILGLVAGIADLSLNQDS